jgi:hypothetical protein
VGEYRSHSRTFFPLPHSQQTLLAKVSAADSPLKILELCLSSQVRYVPSLCDIHTYKVHTCHVPAAPQRTKELSLMRPSSPIRGHTSPHSPTPEGSSFPRATTKRRLARLKKCSFPSIAHGCLPVTHHHRQARPQAPPLRAAPQARAALVQRCASCMKASHSGMRRIRVSLPQERYQYYTLPLF